MGILMLLKNLLKIFDRVVVATTDNINKNYFFTNRGEYYDNKRFFI